MSSFLGSGLDLPTLSVFLSSFLAKVKVLMPKKSVVWSSDQYGLALVFIPISLGKLVSANPL